MAHSRSSALKTLWETLLELVFPTRCAGCGTSGDIWCQRCDRDLQLITGRRCNWCGRPVRGGAVCRGCEQEAPPLQIRSYAMYAEPLVSAILVLKYQPNRQLVARMAGWLHELVARSGWVADVVIPVPLAPDRLRQRGYNQAGLLAASLAQRLHLPEDDRLLQRVRATSSQVGLTPVERRRNVSGAFLGEHRLAQGKHVLIVDDLCTTGATLSECAMALYHAGSKEVRGVTVARA